MAVGSLKGLLPPPVLHVQGLPWEVLALLHTEGLPLLGRATRVVKLSGEAWREPSPLAGRGRHPDAPDVREVRWGHRCEGLADAGAEHVWAKIQTTGWCPLSPAVPSLVLHPIIITGRFLL